jgi:PKD repeat protein
VNFNASGSSDSDGAITSYAWSFGDGGSLSGVTASHTYSNAGTYTAQLTVRDDDGTTDFVTRTIQVSSTPVANNPPTASFTASPTSGQVPLAVSFNASSSSDSDGSITSYAWSFGDGGSSSGVTAAHTYNNAGTYTAQLSVTDDDGATDTTTTQIEVSASSVPEDLYVDANSGSDATGDGTQGNPYKTITKAVDMADAGGRCLTIHVAAGIYNGSLGENFPLFLSNIVLVGEGLARDDVRIVGSIELTSSATLTHVHIYDRVTASGPHIELSDITVENGNLYVQHGADGCRITGSTFVGSYISVQADDCTIGDCVSESGVETYGENCSILRTRFEGTSGNAIRVGGIMPGGSALIEDNTLDGCTFGILITGTAHATIRNNAILNTYNRAIDTGDYTQVIIEGTTVSGTTPGSVIRISGYSVTDLGGGALGSSGQNEISGNTAYNLEDNRVPYSGVLSAKGNTWDDPQPAGTVSGPVDNPPNYKITNEGNSIIFSN